MLNIRHFKGYDNRMCKTSIGKVAKVNNKQKEKNDRKLLENGSDEYTKI